MPPKRKTTGKAAKVNKKAKTEDVTDSGSKTMSDTAPVLKATDEKDGGKKVYEVDTYCPFFASVHENYDCMLNQTNIGQNNNKFYVIQLLQMEGNFYNWTRWGRVGETGQHSMSAAMSLDAAIKGFEKKFKDKTRASWKDRLSFTPTNGKYMFIEMADEGGYKPHAPATSKPAPKAPGKTAPSKLEKPTQDLIKFIFNQNMFQDTMKQFDLDVHKMPLGKLSKGQIAKGFEVLDQIEDEFNDNRKTKINELSSKFYTVIPHSFGRAVPPPIDTLEKLRQKMDMLLVLGDIVVAQTLEKEKEKELTVKAGDIAPDPLDVNYELLNCELEILSPDSKEYKVIEKYTYNTAGSKGDPEILQIWKVNRDGESSLFRAHDDLNNRKLLWHGTSVAVVAAILKSGLRIMPHSGGRAGAGIYFASESDKSAGFVGQIGNRGIMFLNEVALGRSWNIKQNNCDLKSAPMGCDSVLAQGRTEPDRKKNTKLIFDGKEVIVPQGQPIRNPGWEKSPFSQSEYLVYKESQTRIRYLLLVEF